MSWFSMLISGKISLPEDEVIALIRSGELNKNDLLDLLKLIKNKLIPQTVAFETFYAIRNFNHLKIPSVFEEVFKVNYKDIQDFFTRNIQRIKFPIIKNGKGIVATCHLIPLKDSILNFSSVNDELLKIAQKITGKGFAVTFDQNFEQDSFTLALIAGLIAENKDVFNFTAFTGTVDKYGNVLPVDNMEEKRKACLKNNLQLIGYEDIKTINEIKPYLRNILPFPFPIIIGKSKKVASSFFKNFENQTGTKCVTLSKILNMSIKEMGIIHEKYLENSIDAFHELLQERITKRLLKVAEKKEKVVFHITGTISSLMYGAGTIFGLRKKAILYHYQDDEYIPILETARNLKEIKRDRDWIQTRNISRGRGKDIAVTIHIASHDPLGSTIPFVKNRLKDLPHFYITLKTKTGNLPTSQNIWETVVVELYSELNRLRTEHMPDKIHMFLSIPCTLAFAVGACAGQFIPAIIYNYVPGKNEYSAVIQTDKLRSLF